MRTIRASEIGTYLFCQRAWWYQKSGQSSDNLAEMVEGSEMHYQHGRAALQLGCLRTAAYLLILLALVLLVWYFAGQVI
jgi:hypothetical protein